MGRGGNCPASLAGGETLPSSGPAPHSTPPGVTASIRKLLSLLPKSGELRACLPPFFQSKSMQKHTGSLSLNRHGSNLCSSLERPHSGGLGMSPFEDHWNMVICSERNECRFYTSSQKSSSEFPRSEKVWNSAPNGSWGSNPVYLWASSLNA